MDEMSVCHSPSFPVTIAMYEGRVSSIKALMPKSDMMRLVLSPNAYVSIFEWRKTSFFVMWFALWAELLLTIYKMFRKSYPEDTNRS